MYSVGSLAIGVLLTVCYLLWIVGAFGHPHGEGAALAGLVIFFFSLIANLAGVVLGAFGLLLQEARRVALVGIVLNLWPWCFVGFGILFSGC